MPVTRREDTSKPPHAVPVAQKPGIPSSLVTFAQDGLCQYHVRITKLRRSPDENHNDLSLRTLLHRAAKLQPGSS